MNNPDPTHPADLCLQRVFDKTEAYVRREPAKAVAAAFGAGLLLKLLPARAIARPIATLAAGLLPPALLGLGLLKAFELCCQTNHCKSVTAESQGSDADGNAGLPARSGQRCT